MPGKEGIKVWELFQSLFEKAVWFLKLYVIEYRYLVAFLACFVFFYILFMHWLNIRFFRILREPVAIICLVVEIVAIAYFTIFFREQGESHTYELELFWSYKKWILEGSVAFGLEILNNKYYKGSGTVKFFQILASSSEGVNAITLLFEKSLTFFVMI